MDLDRGADPHDIRVQRRREDPAITPRAIRRRSRVAAGNGRDPQEDRLEILLNAWRRIKVCQRIQPLRPPAGLSRVEEAGDHRNQPVGAVDDGEVRGSWQYGELGGRKPGTVAIDAAADKSENLNG